MESENLKRLDEYDIDNLSIKTGFVNNINKKIYGDAFVRGAFTTFEAGDYSLGNWASAISILENNNVSKNGVLKNCSYSKHEFAKELLRLAITRESPEKGENKEIAIALFKAFKNVYVEDSSCLSMPSTLAKHIPGSHSNTGSAATMKIQLLMDLTRNKCLDFGIGSYRDSDAKYGVEIIDRVEPGDLVLRDLGYWKVSVFQEIIKKGADFLSLYRKGVCIYKENGEKINLLKTLKKIEHGGASYIDWDVKLGAKERLEVRLVAVKLPKEVAERKKQEARKNRNKRLKLGADYIYMAGWQILVTSIGRETWSVTDVSRAYRLRWRIEIVFKCFKSKLGLARIFKKASLTPPHAEMLIYLVLSWISITFMKSYRIYYAKVLEKHKVRISLMKFAARFMLAPEKYCMSTNDDFFIKMVGYHCKYDKRKKRQNYEEKLYEEIIKPPKNTL